MFKYSGGFCADAAVDWYRTSHIITFFVKLALVKLLRCLYMYKHSIINHAAWKCKYLQFLVIISGHAQSMWKAAY